MGILVVPLLATGLERVELGGRARCETRETLAPSPAERVPAVPAGGSDRGERGTLLWQYADPLAIPEHVSITPEGAYVWVFQETNSERLQLFRTSSNVPVWEFPLGLFGSPMVGSVDSWSGDSDTLVAARIQDPVGGDTLFAFRPGSSVPVWRHGFTPGRTGAMIHFAGNGSLLVAGGYSYGPPQVVALHAFAAATGDSLWGYEIVDRGELVGLDVSHDGDVILGVTRYDTYVFENGQVRWSLVNPVESDCGAMSGDGQIVCRGDYHGRLLTYTWTGSTYALKWAYHIPPTAGYYNWVMATDVSDDDATIVIGSLEWVSSGYAGRVALFDSSSAVPLWEYTRCGDAVANVATTPDGAVTVCGSWGDIANTLDDLLVFERSSDSLLFSYGSPGSVFGVDVADDGACAAAGAKAVHARIMGSGGFVYSVETGYFGGELVLTGMLMLDGLLLQWGPVPGAAAYWVYGASNAPHFVPGPGPGFDHRLAVLRPNVTSWLAANGIGEPGNDWTYLIMAVNAAPEELARSNRVGEWDFAGDIP